MKNWIIFGSLVCMLVSPILAEEPITEVHLAAPVWEDYTNEDGSGIYLDVLNKAFALSGVTVVHEILPFKRAVQTMLHKEVDGVIAESVVEGRDCLYPQWHVDLDTITAIFKAERFPDWKGQETMAEKAIGWSRGFGFERFLTVPFKRVEFDYYDSGINMLEKDRMDILLDYAEDMPDAFQHAGVDLSNYRMENAFPDLYSYVVFANTERSKALIELFDAGMAALHESGELDAIYQEYYEEDYVLPLREVD